MLVAIRFAEGIARQVRVMMHTAGANEARQR